MTLDVAALDKLTAHAAQVDAAVAAAGGRAAAGGAGPSKKSAPAAAAGRGRLAEGYLGVSNVGGCSLQTAGAACMEGRTGGEGMVGADSRV